MCICFAVSSLTRKACLTDAFFFYTSKQVALIRTALRQALLIKVLLHQLPSHQGEPGFRIAGGAGIANQLPRLLLSMPLLLFGLRLATRNLCLAGSERPGLAAFPDV